ncbi:MBL fold metallo-hydrolase [Ammoniphilus sp. CFH 90114]|uniref:MBL fold metallo-hydrolase n=1 Tax=Ammoniphilus sp. CFH 90114 TaxID=2493665 RepID=UPI00100E8057|nr:MBL fold metallo-hydrolase [Ammoniphilus sp. CFH 90114]RXT15202.1 MBL fold metallo-hydrolase [Ammoniphilus sp. CFH 90114]
MLTASKKGKIERIIIPTPFAVGDVNVYLLIGDAVSLIDVGPNTEEAWKALERGLSIYGLKPSDIDQILLTHHHVDHYGLATRVQERSDAKLYCHPLSEMYVTRHEEKMKQAVQYFNQFYLRHGVPETEAKKAIGLSHLYDVYGTSAPIFGWLQDGESLPGHENWKIYHMPGHSQDHLCFYEQEQRVMIGGDHLIKHISSNAILEAPQVEGTERPKTLLQYRDSMRRCLDFDIQRVHSGHGETISEVRELILNRLERQEQRAEGMLTYLQDGAKTAWEIANQMFGERIEQEMSLILSEVIGHMDLLQDQDKVTTKMQDSIQYYYSK